MSTLIDILTEHRDSKRSKRVFGLVVQGGGMRAVYSAGALAPLISYGFADTFEHVIGASAGAINGAYFLGEHISTLRTYTDDLTNKNFFNLARPGKIVDIDYLVDTVLKYKRPLDIAKLRQSHSQLHVILTNAQTGKKEVISNHQDFIKIYEEFRATAALPLLYDKKVQLGRKWYVDGGVSDLLPIDVALKLGCTDIVVIMTQRIANYHFDRAHSRLAKRLVHHFARNQSLAIRQQLPTNERILQANLRKLTQPLKQVRVYVLEPSDQSALVSLGSTDKPKVEALARLGIADMDTFLHRQLP